MEAFSKHNPNLQLVWDASSLKAYQFCPRFYQLQNLEGWQSDNEDKSFGRLVASGLELFQKSRLDGATIEEALLTTVRWALETTYYEGEPNEPLISGVKFDRQWGGHFETMWKCEGTEKYKNAKGNKAVCPFAFKRMWFPGDAPDVCVDCGSGIRSERRYVPDHPTKNRISLLRTLIWYGLMQPENIEDGYHPYVFPDGTKAVELSGKMSLPWFTVVTQEQYVLAWNLDYIGQLGDLLYITDNKTTKKSLNDAYFDSFSPDTQFDTYDVVASFAYPFLPIQGVMVEAIQLLVSGVEFGYRAYPKTEEQREEHFYDLKHWIMAAEESAEEGYWPMNKRSCWLCAFKHACSKSPEDREAYLNANFVKGEKWNPAQER